MSIFKCIFVFYYFRHLINPPTHSLYIGCTKVNDSTLNSLVKFITIDDASAVSVTWQCHMCFTHNRPQLSYCRHCRTSRLQQKVVHEGRLPCLTSIRLAYCSNVSDEGVSNLCNVRTREEGERGRGESKRKEGETEEERQERKEWGGREEGEGEGKKGGEGDEGEVANSSVM